MPDKRSCSKRCIRCWQNRLKHANKNTKNKSLSVNYNYEFLECEELEDIYSRYIADCLDVSEMKESSWNGEFSDDETESNISSLVYTNYKYWLNVKNISGKLRSKKQVISGIKYQLHSMFLVFVPFNMVKIKPIEQLQFNGTKYMTSKENCQICYDNSNVISNCGHMFCKKCLLQWNISNSVFNSPYCRNDDFILYRLKIE